MIAIKTVTTIPIIIGIESLLLLLLTNDEVEIRVVTEDELVETGVEKGTGVGKGVDWGVGWGVGWEVGIIPVSYLNTLPS